MWQLPCSFARRLSDGREASISEGPAAITCLSASLDGRYMLANLQSHVIHLWPLGDTAAPTHPSSAFPASRPGSADPLDALPSAPLQEYRVGEARPSRYVIRWGQLAGDGQLRLAGCRRGIHL